MLPQVHGKHDLLQALRLDGTAAGELAMSQLLVFVRTCPTLEQLALLGLRKMSTDLLEAITQLPNLQVEHIVCCCWETQMTTACCTPAC